MIFLDHASTTRMSEEAFDVYKEVSKHYYGNTSSLHEGGYNATQIVEASRQEIALNIGAKPHEIYFTSGGTESNERAIRSLTASFKGKKKHVITTKIEHPSILSVFKQLEIDGFYVTYLDVNERGEISLSALEESITDKTVLVSVQHANSEIATVQPINKIGALCAKKEVHFHTDVVQTFGKIGIDVNKDQISCLSISAHKVYGPKGVGAVFISENVMWEGIDPFTASTHESGFRPGTINTPGIAAFAKTAQQQFRSRAANEKKLRNLRDTFASELTRRVPSAVIEGHHVKAVPHIVGFRIPGIEGQYVMLTLDRHGICVSTGSACQVAKQEASHVLSSIGKSDQEAKEFVRVSFGIATTQDELSRTIDIIESIVTNAKTEELPHDRKNKKMAR
ncbi:cysteine desulfurase family protein [Alteribacter populi]|uniref:cysteine desulfurase family protein n=1 Tax=Alteribacter populi TaxID=2011011 RepID=UPI000BBAAA6B|nr:IscS subfamily cysteine desulfurase [Alteribacter populi]